MAPDKLIAAVSKTRDRYISAATTAAKSGNTTSLVGLLADDVVYMSEERGTKVAGKRAIAAQYKKTLANVEVQDLQLSGRSVKTVGDHVVEEGTYKQTLLNKKTNETERSSGNYQILWKAAARNQMQIVRVTWGCGA